MRILLLNGEYEGNYAEIISSSDCTTTVQLDSGKEQVLNEKEGGLKAVEQSRMMFREMVIGTFDHFVIKEQENGEHFYVYSLRSNPNDEVTMTIKDHKKIVDVKVQNANECRDVPFEANKMVFHAIREVMYNFKYQK